MSPAPGEQQALARIECELSRSDPGLAAKFARFAAAANRRSPRSRRWRYRLEPAGRVPIIVMIVISLALVIGCAVMAVTMTSQGVTRGGWDRGPSVPGTHLPGILSPG